MILRRSNRPAILIGAALVFATVALYWPAARFEFINLDDPTYVLQNPKVSQGLTWRGVVWAFTNSFGANWHPLTWISHMVDVSLFGFKPSGHHLMNVAFHAINALLLFLFLRQTTGATWRSALVAGVFAWHPTHVESVAWVSERKDVLSTFFGLLCLMAYGAYARKSEVRSPGFRSSTPHPILSMNRNTSSPRPSPPFGMEERVAAGRERRRVWFRGSTRELLRGILSPFAAERAKWGWYGLALVFLALGLMSKPMLVTWPFVMLLLDVWPLNRIRLSTLHAQRSVPTRLLLEKIPFFALTIASCVLTFHAQRAGGAVQSMSVLLPSARMENAVVSYARYIGKTVWPAELSAFYPHPINWPGGVVLGSALLIGALLAVGLWRIRSQPYILVGVGWFLGTLVPVIGLIQVGGQSMADRYLYIPQIGLLIALVWGLADAAGKNVRARQSAIVLSVIALLVLGMATRRYLPNWQNSILLFQHALTVDEKNPPALYSLGLALSSQEKYDEAIPYLTQAAAMDPNIQLYQGQLALVLEIKGDITGAIERYRKCIELSPDLTEALNNLAWILATSPKAEHRNGADAVVFATRACELTQYDWPMFLGTLAASYAEAGRFPEAIRTAEKAERMARERGFVELADRNATLLETYRQGKPHREPAPTP